MNTWKLSIGVLLLATLACARSEDRRLPPPRAGLELTELLVLGDDPSVPGGLLGLPRFVRTDSAGNIYVADKAAMGIRVYDPAGNPLRTIGSRGRDDGELLDISCFDLGADDELLVADGENLRITRFSTLGELLATYPIEPNSMLWPRRLRQLGPDRHLFLYKMPAIMPSGFRRPDARYLFHLYDDDLSEKQLAFGRFDAVAPDSSQVADYFMQHRPGSLWTESDGSFLYAPSLYRGEIYRYEARGKGFERTTLHGYVSREQPFVEADSADYERPELNFRVRTQQRVYAGLLHNESRGLFRLNDGRVAHFTLIAEDGGRVFGVEIFRRDGTLEGYEPLQRVADQPGQATRLPLYVDWKDSDDRFYLRQLRPEGGVVKVVRLDRIAALEDTDPGATRDRSQEPAG